MFATLKMQNELGTPQAPAVWKSADGRAYQTADVSAAYPDYRRAFFLKLPPGAALHPHVDAGDCATDHIVISTNPACLNWWRDESGDHAMHMEQGQRYTVNRTVLHWSTNDGETDRIHLLLEY